jgi:hypothetical protein
VRILRVVGVSIERKSFTMHPAVPGRSVRRRPPSSPPTTVFAPDVAHANLRFETTRITFAARSCRALFEMGIRQDVRKGTDLPSPDIFGLYSCRRVQSLTTRTRMDQRRVRTDDFTQSHLFWRLTALYRRRPTLRIAGKQWFIRNLAQRTHEPAARNRRPRIGRFSDEQSGLRSTRPTPTSPL